MPMPWKRVAGFVVAMVGALGTALPAGAAEWFDGRLEMHGALEFHFRTINNDFRHEWDLSQWRNQLDLEFEARLIEEPLDFLPWLDDATFFARTSVSYDCVWRRGCGMLSSADAYGNRAKGIPSYYRTGKRNGFVGDDPALNPVNPQTPYHSTPPLGVIADATDLAAGAPGKFLDSATTRRERTSRLVGISDTPPFEILGSNFSFNTAFAPVLDYRFAVKQNSVTSSNGDSSGIDATVLMWRPKDKAQNLGLLSSVTNQSNPGLDFRPAFLPHPSDPTKPVVDPATAFEASSRRRARGLFNPSAAVRRLDADHNIDRYDQNFHQNSELAWNFGASQDEYILREAYLDLNLFDSRLFLRLGKQTIIWGKTELFRNQDQFNPQDLALVTLPELEDSRIPLWALRAIWSFWDVGPLEDVRLEFVWMLDDFEPNDVGRCGEPYAPLPVCDKTFGVTQHGILGAGLVGETRPPNWWEDASGLELGLRLEFRWDRFSFAVTDFWHYEDSAVPRLFYEFDRRVDLESGRPIAALAPQGARCLTGNEKWCLKPGATGPNNAFANTPQNRQLYDVICASSVRFLETLDPTVCALTVPNSTTTINSIILPPLTPAANPYTQGTVAGVISATAAGNPAAAGVLGTIAGTPFTVIGLHPGLCDDFMEDCDGFGAGTPIVPTGGFASTPFPVLAEVLSNQQEALLGCGPFFSDPAAPDPIDGPGGVPYSGHCDVFGIDLFNTEASVLFQAWSGVRPGSAVATRLINGQLRILAGARGPGDPGYDPLIDGCVGNPAADPRIPAFADPAGACAAMLLADTLEDPRTGEPFANEMAALSFNALQFLVALDLGTGAGGGCAFPSVADPNAPINCPTVQDFFSVTQVTRPALRAGGNGRFGRRDFAWAGAGEIVLEYDKVNTLGIAADFSEDRTGTNWGLELSWTTDKDFVNSEVPSLRSDSDVIDLTISVDRPTFIHFLNRERTFFFNMQWFIEYIPDHVGIEDGDSYRGYAVDGPVSALGVFTFETGFFQDRLIPSATFVYDVKSESGAVALDLRYRFSAVFSVTIGMNHFYGPGDTYTLPIGLGALGESNQSYRTERYSRLNAVRERDELFAVFRYTF
jgi:hypothetical protein